MAPWCWVGLALGWTTTGGRDALDITIGLHEAIREGEARAPPYDHCMRGVDSCRSSAVPELYQVGRKTRQPFSTNNCFRSIKIGGRALSCLEPLGLACTRQKSGAINTAHAVMVKKNESTTASFWCNHAAQRVPCHRPAHLPGLIEEERRLLIRRGGDGARGRSLCGVWVVGWGGRDCGMIKPSGKSRMVRGMSEPGRREGKGCVCVPCVWWGVGWIGRQQGGGG